MSTRMLEAMMGLADQLRYEPTEKRIRATIEGATVVDSTRALHVWELRRIIPSYGVPVEDVRGQLRRAGEGALQEDPGAPILNPGFPFGVHSAKGEPLTLEAAGATREAAAFRFADADLADHVVLDFDAFDAWYEEDQRRIGHPRDPFHRIDVLESSRQVRIELDGEVLAESSRPRLLFETYLPVRFYLPPEDLRVGSRPVAKKTICAYKGEASYLELDLKGGPRGPRLDLPGPGARGRRGDRSRRLLRREGRRDR